MQGGAKMTTFPARPTPSERRIYRIELKRISPNPDQPRREFDENSVRELAASIRSCGLLSPLLVRRKPGGEYELIAGERRLRALQLLGRTEAEALILNAQPQDRALIALIENLQREDLHFLDEAEACRRILQNHGMTQEQLAAMLAKSPSALANRLRLLRLGDDVRILIRSGRLSERHARALLKLENEDLQLQYARLAIDRQLSVRQLEQQIENCQKQKKTAPLPSRLLHENRLIINALRDTVRRLSRIGVRASSHVVTYDDHFDVIVTVRTLQEAQAE